jgi:hypothetical protein
LHIAIYIEPSVVTEQFSALRVSTVFEVLPSSSPSVFETHDVGLSLGETAVITKNEHSGTSKLNLAYHLGYGTRLLIPVPAYLALHTLGLPF